MGSGLPQRSLRFGIVTALAASAIILGACSRPGGGNEPTATETPQRIGSPTVTRSAPVGRTPTAANTTPAAPGGGAGTTPPAAPAVNPTQTPPPTVQGERYVVQPGDTLVQIADRYGVTVEAIVEANKLDNPDELRIGQELIIPAP